MKKENDYTTYPEIEVELDKPLEHLGLLWTYTVTVEAHWYASRDEYDKIGFYYSRAELVGFDNVYVCQIDAGKTYKHPTEFALPVDIDTYLTELETLDDRNKYETNYRQQLEEKMLAHALIVRTFEFEPPDVNDHFTPFGQHPIEPVDDQIDRALGEAAADLELDDGRGEAFQND